MRGSSKSLILVATYLLLLITSFPSAVTFGQEDGNDSEIVKIENLSDLFNFIVQIEGRFSDYEGNIATVSCEVVGEETVGGNDCWKVEVAFEAEGSVTNATLWVSKATGICVKARVGDTTFTGDFAESIGAAFFQFWLVWILDFWETWSYTKLNEWHYTYKYGFIEFLGTETINYGPTNLLVYKYKFHPYSIAPENYRWIVEGWIAPTQFGGLLVYLHVEAVDRQEWYNWELTSIKLREPQKLPKLQFEELSLSSHQVEPNENFTVSIKLSNTGDAFAIYNITLIVDGELRGSKVVFIDAGANKTVTFTLSLEAEGEHIIELDGKTAEIYVGKVSPPSFELSNLNINPSTLKVGEEVEISVKVSNSGGSAGSYNVTLKINGEVIDSRQVTLDSGESTIVTFRFKPEVQGTFTVEIDGLKSSFQVSLPEEPEKPSPISSSTVMLGIAAVAIVAALMVAVYFMKMKK